MRPPPCPYKEDAKPHSSQMPFSAKDYGPPRCLRTDVSTPILVDPRPARWLRDSLTKLGGGDTYSVARTLWETVELSVDRALRAASRFPDQRSALQAG